MTAKETRNRALSLAHDENYIEALKMFERAYELGDLNAINDIGVIYERMGMYQEAFENYRNAACYNIPVAWNNIGCLYRNGYGVKQNYAKAIEYYEKAVNSGYFSAYKNLYEIYSEGLGVERDIKKAIKYLKTGVKGELKSNDNTCACIVQLDYILVRGINIKKNYREGYKLMKKAETKKQAPIYHNLGCHYLNGLGTKKNIKKALYYLNLAADKNYSNSLRLLGELYVRGNGVNKDLLLGDYYLTRGIRKNSLFCGLFFARVCLEKQCDDVFFTLDDGKAMIHTLSEVLLDKDLDEYKDEFEEYQSLRNDFSNIVNFKTLEVDGFEKKINGKMINA